MDIFKHKKLGFKVYIKKEDLKDVLIEMVSGQGSEMVERYMDIYHINWFHWLAKKEFFEEYALELE